MNPLPLTRSRLIQASVEIRDRKDERDTFVAIVAASLIFGVALVASALTGFLP